MASVIFYFTLIALKVNTKGSNSFVYVQVYFSLISYEIFHRFEKPFGQKKTLRNNYVYVLIII